MLKILLTKIVRGRWERCEVGDFVTDAVVTATRWKCQLTLGFADQEPTPAARNMTVHLARKIGADMLFMVDHDMAPSKTFFTHAVQFLQSHPGPTVIASPYCGDASCGRLVHVFDHHPEGGEEVRVGRADAFARTGDQEVAGIGTGVFAANLKAFDVVEKPYFDYDYTSEERILVRYTEDTHFCRRLVAAGGKVFAAWSHWSGHCKTEIVQKPQPEPAPCPSKPPATAQKLPA